MVKIFAQKKIYSPQITNTSFLGTLKTISFEKSAAFHNFSEEKSNKH